MKSMGGFVILAISIPLAYGDQGGFRNSGGSLSGGSPVAAPAGTVTISGGNLTFLTTDGSTQVNATFSTSSTVESCSGGGKGGHVTCSFTFTGSFSGALTVNGVPQAINGSTYQIYGTDGVVIAGLTGYNSTYTPFYFSNSGQLLRSDDLNGDNMISYGTQGSGVGQFYGAYGIALDAAGRIYVADTYNGRVVRIDDMNGTNWTSFGTWGSGVGQFMDPQGISIDPSGRIYVMDTGNNRLVRIDDLNGTNWTTVSAVGSGVGQFTQFVNPVAFDSTGRIYWADGGNRRIVRMDDLNFTNWTTLTQSPVINTYVYTFGDPQGIAVDAASRIYVLDGSSVVRVDDMTGTNWTSISLGQNATPHSIAVDAGGMVLVGGGGAQTIDNMLAVQQSSSTLTQFYGPYYVFGATLLPVPSPRPSAITFTPPTLTFSQNVGTTSPAQTVTIANIGGSPLSGLNVSATGVFGQTNNCPSMLIAGSNCTVSVTFTPAVQGTVTGTLNVSDSSGNLGPTQTLTLNGTGTAPAATVTPASLSFQSQVVGTTSNARNITVQSTGTGPLQISNVAITGPFSQTSNCIGTIAAGASCSIQVKFTPTALGQASGIVTISDNAGTQTVNLSGSGVAPVTVSPASLSFGNMAVGETSAARSVTLTNRQSIALNISGVTIGGNFAIATNSCGASLAAGASCSVGVTFTPPALGSFTGTLTFADDANNSPQTASLSGTGSAPVSLSSTSISFNSVVVGVTSSAHSVTLTNQQNVALNFSSIAATAPFAIASNTCGASIAAGAQCKVGVTFTPTTLGAATGTLTFTDDAAGSPQSVSLSGTGVAPVTLSTTALNFGTIAVSTTSSTRSVTLTNHQSVSLTFSSIVATTSFTISSNTCGGSIAAGASCSVGVKFAPTAAGTVNGTLTFTDSAGNSPQVVTLSGTGQ